MEITNRRQELVMLIADFLTDWVESDESAVMSVEDSIKAIESYGESFKSASAKLVTNSIRHLIETVNPWNKSEIPVILTDMGFSEEECGQYWH